ncbi:uncharacterized protein AB675_10811 [Cyphellophora attinorum]|uniref:Uncharacterized protein n=1 Tax=Cyphellophora attinorum TaxID=1664694 RepID=A0A0N1HAI3_9EURO|nr:uncharacterized protein AB675_10811 [Phialophora attinorum]KPI40866.1 hypothetical protein AB675_10811 [Phialophora attinorum]
MPRKHRFAGWWRRLFRKTKTPDKRIVEEPQYVATEPAENLSQDRQAVRGAGYAEPQDIVTEPAGNSSQNRQPVRGGGYVQPQDVATEPAENLSQDRQPVRGAGYDQGDNNHTIAPISKYSLVFPPTPRVVTVKPLRCSNPQTTTASHNQSKLEKRDALRIPSSDLNPLTTSEVIVASTWDKPRPRLNNMPLEILEKIIRFITGDLISVEMHFQEGESRGTVAWHPWEVPQLLLVSRYIRQVTQSLLLKTCTELEPKTHLDAGGASNFWMPAAELAPRHFEKLFVANRSVGSK